MLSAGMLRARPAKRAVYRRKRMLDTGLVRSMGMSS